MNKTYFRIRCIIAWVTGMLCFLAFFSAFYPVKIFDLQLTALLQRFLVDVSLTAAILLSALLLLTLFSAVSIARPSALSGCSRNF